MNYSRISAVVVRHMYSFRRNFDRLSDSIYWPIMDLIVWGLTTVWLQNTAGTPHLLFIMLTAVVFWQIVWRSNYEISVNLLEESWCRNVVNLFSTPLTVGEWVSAVMVVGLAKVVLGILVGVAASWALYSLNILTIGFALLPFTVLLILFGWTMGFLGAGIIARFGRQFQTIAWMMGFLFAPLSAVYYPVSVLPAWLQPAAYALPPTYVFEGMRKVVTSGVIDWEMLLQGAVLSLGYLALAVWFFMAMFEHRRRGGLQGLD
jgi:ABC-2 type transport system permease protein